MGAHMVSTIMHVGELWGFGRGAEFTHMARFFIMIGRFGLAFILERKWKLWTDKEVAGVLGVLWAATWQLRHVV